MKKILICAELFVETVIVRKLAQRDLAKKTFKVSTHISKVILVVEYRKISVSLWIIAIVETEEALKVSAKSSSFGAVHDRHLTD